MASNQAMQSAGPADESTLVDSRVRTNDATNIGSLDQPQAVQNLKQQQSSSKSRSKSLQLFQTCFFSPFKVTKLDQTMQQRRSLNRQRSSRRVHSKRFKSCSSIRTENRCDSTETAWRSTARASTKLASPIN